MHWRGRTIKESTFMVASLIPTAINATFLILALHAQEEKLSLGSHHTKSSLGPFPLKLQTLA